MIQYTAKQWLWHHGRDSKVTVDEKWQNQNQCMQIISANYSLKGHDRSWRENINKNFLIGPRPKYPRSVFKWPSQPSPSKQALKVWNKYVRQVLNIQSNNTLAPYYSFQHWIISYSQRYIIHEVNVDIITNNIYIRTQEKIERYNANEQDYNSIQLINYSKRVMDFISDIVIPAKRNK